MFEYTLSAAGGFINNLVKANEPVVQEIDNDTELTKKFKDDMSQLEEVRTSVEEMVGMLFDQEQTSTREDHETKYLDIVMSRATPYSLLRRGGETETPRMIKQFW